MKVDKIKGLVPEMWRKMIEKKLEKRKTLVYCILICVSMGQGGYIRDEEEVQLPDCTLCSAGGLVPPREVHIPTLYSLMSVY